MFFSFFKTLLSHLHFFSLHLSGSNSFPQPLSSAEEKHYLDLFSKGDKNAGDILIEHNLRLVAHIAKKYYSGNDDKDDLISIGTIGLIKGIRTFNAKKGARLATYASRCIENEILMYFRSQSKSMQDVYMSEPIDVDSEGNPLTLMDIMFSNDTIIDDIDLKIKTEQIRKFVNEISDDRERNIIIMRYGFDNKEPLTQREVAKIMNISRSYVSRIEKKALEKLRNRFN